MSGRPVIWQLAIGASKNFRLGPDRNCIDLNQQPIDQAPINLDGSELPAYEQSLVKAFPCGARNPDQRKSLDSFAARAIRNQSEKTHHEYP